MIKKLFISAVIALPLLSGCAGMADATSKMAGLGVVSEEQSTFDGATVVTVSPNWLYDPQGAWGNSVKLGGHWSSAQPDLVALVLSYGSDTKGGKASFLNLNGIDINVDGDIKSFSAMSTTDHDHSTYNTVSRTFYTQSVNAVVIPYALLERMVSAKDTRIRIHTSKGYQDALFSTERIPGGQGTAISSFREFVQKIKSKKPQS